VTLAFTVIFFFQSLSCVKHWNYIILHHHITCNNPFIVHFLSNDQSHYESSPSSFDECRLRLNANPQTKPIDLGCESAKNWLLPSTSTIAIVIIAQPVSWYSFYHPTKDGRLSRPRNCSKVQSPCPRLHIAVAVMINATNCSVIRTWDLSHHSQTN